MISSDVAAVLEADKSGSGLYHSRLYTKKPGQEPIHQWIERHNLPLPQQVTLIHEATGTLYHQPLRSKDASWVDEPATDKQLAALKRMYPRLAGQIENAHMTKGQASDAITACLLRRTLNDPPSPDEESDENQSKHLKE